MKRFKHSLSHYRLLTCTFGELVPIGLVEALPGDTIQHSSSALVRVAPLVAPVMHPVQVRIHHWFVPHRLNWDEFADSFITGGSDGEGDSYTYPTLGGLTSVKGDVLDYLGVPPGAKSAGDLSALPVRAYNKIFNENYRDQDLVAEVSEDQTTVQKIAWGKDYFTSARPWAQKGPAVTLPLGTTAPVVGIDGSITGHTSADATERVMSATPLAIPGATAGEFRWNNPQLEADLTNASAATVNAIREAMALQRYQEARAQYGNRYVEYLRYCGINPSDARLQRPEYLGGGKTTIAFSEVLNTTGANTPGAMAGHGISAMRTNRYRYFCSEHGYVMSLLSIRPMTMYMDGVARTWTKRNKEDYFQKELQFIGQQEVRNDEVYYQNTSADDDTFGYQNRYDEYRHEESRVSGDFRDTLDHWHLGRQFGSLPTLNSSFIECDPSTRIFASASTDTFWIMVNHSIQARRMVSRKTIGRIN